MKTTVITLTWNRAPLLKKCLSSLSRQSEKPFEVIIINDNSQDETENVINNYHRILPIKTFKTKIMGYPKLYNLGISKARGKLICFFDDDCVAEKDWLKELINNHKKNPKSVIQGQTFSLPKNNIYAQIMGDHYQNWLKSHLLANNKELRFLDNKNCAIPKKIIDETGGFSEICSGGSEDLELGARLRKKGIKIIFAPKVIAWHHERSNFKEFISQHFRIAKSESLLHISCFSLRKTYLNIMSGIKREICYLKQKEALNVFKLPFIYLALFSIRFYGYFLKRSS